MKSKWKIDNTFNEIVRKEPLPYVVCRFISVEAFREHSKLISKAPEMYEALRKLHNELEQNASWIRFGESSSHEKLNWLLEKVQKSESLLKEIES